MWGKSDREIYQTSPFFHRRQQFRLRRYDRPWMSIINLMRDLCQFVMIIQNSLALGSGTQAVWKYGKLSCIRYLGYEKYLSRGSIARISSSPPPVFWRVWAVSFPPPTFSDPGWLDAVPANAPLGAIA